VIENQERRITSEVPTHQRRRERHKILLGLIECQIDDLHRCCRCFIAVEMVAARG